MSASGIFIVIVTIIFFSLIDWGVKKAVHTRDHDSRIITQFRILFVLWYFVISYFASRGNFSLNESITPFLTFIFLGLFFILIVSFTKITEALSHLDWQYIIGFHSIRIITALSLYFCYLEDKIPMEQTFLGFNYDILSGVIAALIAPSLAYRSRLKLVKAWNFISLLLLLSQYVLIFLSLKSDFQIFHSNTSLENYTQVPYIYLITIFLNFTLLGHFVVFKKIKSYSY